MINKPIIYLKNTPTNTINLMLSEQEKLYDIIEITFITEECLKKLYHLNEKEHCNYLIKQYFDFDWEVFTKDPVRLTKTKLNLLDKFNDQLFAVQILVSDMENYQNEHILETSLPCLLSKNFFSLDISDLSTPWIHLGPSRIIEGSLNLDMESLFCDDGGELPSEMRSIGYYLKEVSYRKECSIRKNYDQIYFDFEISYSLDWLIEPRYPHGSSIADSLNYRCCFYPYLLNFTADSISPSLIDKILYALPNATGITVDYKEQLDLNSDAYKLILEGLEHLRQRFPSEIF